jgi:hypothetical protein
VTALTGIALLTLLAVAGGLAAACLRRAGWAELVLGAYVVAWAELVGLVFLLSPSRLVRPGPLLAAEAIVALVVVAAWVAHGRPLPARPSRLRRPDLPVAILAVAVGLAVAYAAFLVVAVPPNTYDSMTYHLPRAAQWYETGGWGVIEHAPTDRQNVFPPNAELGILYTFLLAGSDRLAEAPQLLALLALVLGIGVAARRLGCSTAAAAFAGLLFATFSVVALQATTTQNDLVVASFLVAAVAFLLGRRGVDCALAGLAVALALGTKSTAALALPIVALLAIAVLPRRRLLAFGGWTVAAVVAIASWPYLRNLRDTDSLLSGQGVDEHRAEPTPAGVAATSFRVVYRLLDLSGYERVAEPVLASLGLIAVVLVALVAYERLRGRPAMPLGSATGAALALLAPVAVLVAASLARATVDAAGLDVSPESATGGFFTWHVMHRADEDVSYMGPLGASVAVLPLLALRGRLPERRAVFALALAVPLFVLGLAAAYRYNAWIGRFVIVPVALAAPLLAVLHRWRPVALAAAVVGALTLVLAHAFNVYKPTGIGGDPAVWSLSRAETFALTAPRSEEAAAAYARYDELVPVDARVGALFGPNDPVYPLHDAGLRRRVVYLSRTGPVADAERRGLRIVVVGAAESAAPFATAPGWRTRSLAGYWALVTREG